MRNINSQAIAEPVFKSLRESEIFQVSIKFTHGLLLQSRGQTLFIGDGTTSRGPFHIILRNDDFVKLCRVSIGDFFTVEKNYLIYQDVVINIFSNTCYDVKVIEVKEPSFLMSSLTKTLEKEVTGFDVPVKNLISEGIDGVTPKRVASFLIDEEKRVGDFLLSLVGRGRGLTPTGDDFLIGIFSLFQENKFLLQVLNKIVATEGQTTIVSYSYYRAALKNNFDWRINQMFRAANNRDGEFLKKHINIVKNYGGSSGIDLLTGMLFGLFIKI